MRLPTRHGVLFDPDRFPFPRGPALRRRPRQIHERIEPPLVPDGTIYRALGKAARPRRRTHLLPRARRRADRLGLRDDDGLPARDGNRTLGGDQGAEETGRARRRSTSTRCSPRPSSKRDKWLQDRADRKLTDTSQRLRSRMAATLEDLHVALCCRWSTAPPRRTSYRRGRWCSSPARSAGARARTTRRARSPSRSCARRSRRSSRAARRRWPPAEPEADPRPQGLRPSDGLGRVPRRDLSPARRRAGRGVARPRRTSRRSPPTRTRSSSRARLVAQRCLYGVDRNPVAVDLAKMSLWLATLATRSRAHLRRPRACATATRSWASRTQIAGVPLGRQAPRLPPVRIREHLDASASCARDSQRRRRRERLGAT